MSLELYECKGMLDGKPCPNKIKKFSSTKDPKSKKIADRPRCSKCGTRI